MAFVIQMSSFSCSMCQSVLNVFVAVYHGVDVIQRLPRKLTHCRSQIYVMRVVMVALNHSLLVMVLT